MEYSPEQLIKHFGDPTGFSRISNTLVHFYTLLDGFDVTIAGLYAFLRSWRNTTNEDIRGIVSFPRIFAFAGTIGAWALIRRSCASAIDVF
ncbi:hypothetical protein [Peribacillus sp. NPDC058075]|uniref:hypothetical protein n=1 Tax=unclassified Peribacillus TaxID=2675266 RepID=UPI0036D75F58